MRFLASIGVLAILLAIAAVVYFFGGFYNVGATGSENQLVSWFISQARIASIRKDAPTTPPINLEDSATIKAGAHAFATRGCVSCHGAPGAEWAKFAEGMSPDPADLKEVAKHVPAGEIFWVIKNGINMTGMPSFSRVKVGDPEIWAITAFVKQLPSISPDEYKNWSKAENP